MIMKVFNFFGAIAFAMMFNIIMSFKLINAGFPQMLISILCIINGMIMPMAIFNWLYKQDNKEEEIQQDEQD